MKLPFENTSTSGGADGLLYGDLHFFFIQKLGMLIVVTYSFVVSFVIFKFINFIQPIRVTSEEEEVGLDATQHNEKYLHGAVEAKSL